MTNIFFQHRIATDQERIMVAQSLLAHTETMIGQSIAHEAYGQLAYEEQKCVGAVIGKIFCNWMHLDLVWVEEGYRLKGIGKRLLENCYQYARQKGLSGIEVWTQSWQAPEFYIKNEYVELVAFDDFFPGRKRHILRRTINSAAS